MSLDISLLDLAVLGLASYRLSVMLSNDWEQGPFNVLGKIRKAFGVVYDEHGNATAIPGSAGDGLLCNNCNSIWIGLILAGLHAGLQLAGLPASFLLSPLALSGLVVLLVNL